MRLEKGLLDLRKAIELWRKCIPPAQDIMLTGHDYISVL